MDELQNIILGNVTLAGFAAALLVGLIAGVIKGMVGFGLPTVLISGLTVMLAPDVALAALIFPTLVANAMQALRGGIKAALIAVNKYRVFLLAGLVFMIGSAQLVMSLSQSTLFLLIGMPVSCFALLQLGGWEFRLPNPTKGIEMAVGAVTGFIGGLSGVWGPPTVAYLTAINTPKAEQIRVQGVIYGLGAMVLAVAHLKSGVLRAETIPLSVVMILPAVLGMVIGVRIQDRINQARFKQVTLAVLLIAGLNLVRRGLF
jgi:uncharacterized protein